MTSVQLPSMHWPLGQWLPQPPQFSGSFCVSMHWLLQLVRPSCTHGSEAAQTPFWQKPLPQTTPQVPQLLASCSMSAPQLSVPPQPPETQVQVSTSSFWPAGQVMSPQPLSAGTLHSLWQCGCGSEPQVLTMVPFPPLQPAAAQL